MTYSVYQHWDPLKTCVVGRSYPPEFYSWITKSHVRSLFEQIAEETEQDFQRITAKLEELGVTVLRPTLPDTVMERGQYIQPPMTPRDHFVMIGDTFYIPRPEHEWQKFYQNVKDPAWPDLPFDQLPTWIQQECQTVHGWTRESEPEECLHGCYRDIIQHLKQQQVPMRLRDRPWINGAMVSRIGRDLYFGTESLGEDLGQHAEFVRQAFPEYRTHVIDTGGHGDGTYCPVCPGLIITLDDARIYEHTFPDWEVLRLPNQSWDLVEDFLHLKRRNRGRWWIPGFEHDDSVTEVVETWMKHWTGYVEETVFDVNMLIVDPKNVILFNYNQTVFDALDRYGITAHVVPFRHRYFWDGGIHCVTLDLDRSGTMQDFFPSRG